MKTNVSKTVLWITRTAVFLALLVAVQFLTRSLGQLVTGSAVNFVLVACALIAGLSSGATVAVISPFAAKLLGIGPLWEFIPVIALANVVIVLVFSLLLGRARRKEGPVKYALWVTAIAAGAAAKFLVLYLGIVKILIPLMSSIPAPQAEKLSAMFSVTQLFTALIGGVIAMLLVEPLRTAIRKSRE
ncbi:MAG: ECF transporter S component [Clostridiales bacterium]|nr:MAG: ECF transporter S component [Clostridiales bacterium]